MALITLFSKVLLAFDLKNNALQCFLILIFQLELYQFAFIFCENRNKVVHLMAVILWLVIITI